jgi:ribosomal-protein-alanine N-acetyltransferase
VVVPQLVDPIVPAGRLNRLPQPVLTVDELVLRPWRGDDVPAVVAAYQDPEIQRWHVRSMTESEAGAWVLSWADKWRTETGAEWAVVEQNTVVGRTGLRALDLAEGHGEAAYWVTPLARGRGVAARAANAVSEWMFAEVGLNRIELEHSTANVASCRVALAAGFASEGTRRRAVRHADGWHDMHQHARLRNQS